MTVDINQLRDLGWITTQRHPTLPLTVCKYSRHFQAAGNWDDVMLTMRGAVVDDHGVRVNHPMHKFFNLGEAEAPTGRFTVQEKLDGTCIVVFQWEGKVLVHTLGAFGSPQALAAREWIERNFGWDWMLEEDTYVFEWMDPDNFTTLRWRGESTLKLLFVCDGVAEIAVEPSGSWPGEIVRTLDLQGDPEALAGMVRDDEEGYVLVYDDIYNWQRRRLKVKGARYLELHRMVWNLSETTVWEMVFQRSEMERALFRSTLDEEARMWFDETAARMKAAVADLRGQADAIYESIRESDKRLMAARIKMRDADLQPYLFMRMNGKPGGDGYLAKLIKPKGHTAYASLRDSEAA